MAAAGIAVKPNIKSPRSGRKGRGQADPKHRPKPVIPQADRCRNGQATMVLRFMRYGCDPRRSDNRCCPTPVAGVAHGLFYFDIRQSLR